MPRARRQQKNFFPAVALTSGAVGGLAGKRSNGAHVDDCRLEDNNAIRVTHRQQLRAPEKNQAMFTERLSFSSGSAQIDGCG